MFILSCYCFSILLFQLLFIHASITITTIDNTKVHLEVYIESGCPISQGFMKNELTYVLSLQDIVDILYFKYVPFGNSYKDNHTYSCYDENECITDSIQLCSLYKLSNHLASINTGNTSLLAYPFVSCKLHYNVLFSLL